MGGGKALALGGTLLLAVPAAFIFASGAGDTTTDDAAGGELDAKAVPAQYQPWVKKGGSICALITPPVIAAQIDSESNWNPNARSPVGAQGISQFMPATWKEHGVDVAGKDGAARPDGTADVFTPGDAITSQGHYDCYLAELVQARLKKGIIKGDALSLTLAAYNAGIGAVENAGGIPNFPETQGYVFRILGLIPHYTAATATAPGANDAQFGNRVVAHARKWLGTPYSWGGGSVAGPGYGFAQGAGIKGFDCSSLVQYAVYHASGGNAMLPRTTYVQVNAGKEVPRGQIQAGDAILFKLNGGDWDHIGIYVGNNRMIHAPKTGDVVKEVDLADAYYSSKPQAIRRYG